MVGGDELAALGAGVSYGPGVGVDELSEQRAIVAALVEDPAASARERANASALKEQRLREAGAPAGDWTDISFGSAGAKALRKSTSPA